VSLCERSPSVIRCREIRFLSEPKRDRPLLPLSRRRGWTARRLFAAVLIGGLLVRLMRLGMNSPLWGDEAMLVRSFLTRTYAELFRPLDYAQLAPLGFLWAELTCYRLFGPAEWVWRLVPTLAGCLSLVGFVSFARNVLPRHAAWLALAILASSLYLIRHTVEAKPYIVDFAIALSLAQLGWRLHERPHRIGSWIAFGVVSALGVWCSFPSAFAAGGILLSLLGVVQFTGWSSARQIAIQGPRWIPIAWFACGLSLTVSFAVMYLTFGQVQIRTANAAGYWQMSMWEVAYPPWQRPDLFLWWLIREHAGLMMAHPFGGKNFASLGTFLLVICGVVTLRRRNPRLTTMLLAPAALGLLAACLRKYPYGGTARTMLYLAPAICLFAGAGGWAAIVRFLSAPVRRKAYSLAMLGCLALIAARLLVEVVFPYKQYGDWVARDAVRRWAAEAQPNDVWVIANAAALPDQSLEGILGGNTAAVFDHYALLSMGDRAWHPHEVVDFPPTGGRVLLLADECPEKPATLEIGQIFCRRFEHEARLIGEETVYLDGNETLRKLVFSRQP
jgi:hypothetical protein